LNEKNITCIICPIGCKIKVRINERYCEIVDGNKCRKGVEYAQLEALDPRRVLTSSILVRSGDWPLVSVKTTKPIPKEKISLVLEEIKNMIINAPVSIGDILIENVCNLNIDVIATKNVERLTSI
jgi:CxxC motif-containing protein